MRYNNEDDIRVKHNSHSSSHGVVICVEIDFDIPLTARTDIQRALLDWISAALTRARQHNDPHNEWHFVCGVRHDQWHDTEGNRKVNGMQFTVHFGADEGESYAWPLFRNDVAERISVDAADIAQSLYDIPSYVICLGVSAVSQPRLAHEWLETVHTEPICFCIPGLGLRRHPMYTIEEGASCCTVGPERSERFRWPNYPNATTEAD